jgi:hypothetical protein
MDLFMDQFSDKVIPNASRTAINRTLTSTRAQAVKVIRLRLNIKAKDLKGKHTAITKASGKNLMSMVGVLSFSDKPMPLLDFVTGKHSRASQKGIKVKNRKLVKVKVLKGKAVKLKKAFITKVRSTQVFKRSSDDGFYKQGVPSIAVWVQRDYIEKPLKDHANKTFNKVFRQQYEFRVEKAIAKANKAKLR